LSPADSADVELEELIQLFYDDPNQLGRFLDATSDDVPEPANQLLAHNHHMTVTVERFHDCPVNVKVLESTTQGDHYSRKIILTRQSDDVVVMFGIVRLDMSVLSPEVRAEIEAKETPLGRILIKHDVWRVVKLLNLFKIEAGDDLIASMKRSSDDVFFGRTALIYCDGSPAIELLEVVAQ
jgi:chorismate-pyruvate lyase